MSWSKSTDKVSAADFPMALHKLEIPQEAADAGYQRAFDAGKHSLTLFFAAESLGAPAGTLFQGSISGHDWHYPGQPSVSAPSEGVQVSVTLMRTITLPMPAGQPSLPL